MIDGTEGQAVLPAAAEVCDLNILPQNILDEDKIQLAKGIFLAYPDFLFNFIH